MAYEAYDPLTTLQSLQGATQIRDANLNNRMRQFQLAETARQLKQEADMRSAAAAAMQPQTVTSPTQDIPLPGGGSIQAGGNTAQGPVGFDRATYLAKLSQTAPLEAVKAQHDFAVQDLATQNAHIEFQKNLAGLSKDQLGLLSAKSELMARDANSILALPPEQRAQAVQDTLVRRTQSGVYSQREAQQAWASYQQNGDAFLHHVAIAGIDAKSIFDKQAQQPTEAGLAATAAGIQPGVVPTQAQATAALGQLAKTKRESKVVVVTGGGAGPNGDIALIDPVKQPNKYKIAQDLAYGRLTIQQLRSMYAYSRDTAGKQSLYATAQSLNPDFNPAAFESGFKLASNPKVQQQLASLDNVVKAVPDLIRISNDASRSGIPAINGLIQKGGYMVGGTRYSNFHAAQIAFADELSGALGYGSATDMSREMGINMTDPNLSPESFASQINDVVIPFIQRKRSTLLNQMGVYGKPGMNPAADAAQQESGTGAIEFVRDAKGNLVRKTK